MASSNILELNWYDILGLSIGASQADIARAARKMSLKYHSDKTDDPSAPEKFLLVQKAKEILSDEKKKLEIDEHFKSKQKRKEYEASRNISMDSKRKKMKEDLENSVSAAKRAREDIASRAQKPTATTSRATTYSNLDKLRKEGAAKKEAYEDELREKEQKQKDNFEFTKKVVEPFEAGNSAHQIKVKWKRNRQSHSDESLYQLFKEFGSIETVTLAGNKGTSAVITFTDAVAADKALRAYDLSTEYRVTRKEAPGLRSAAVFRHVYTTEDSTASGGVSYLPSLRSTAAGLFTSSALSSEPKSELETDMRRALERERLLRQLEAELERETGVPASEAAAPESIRGGVSFSRISLDQQAIHASDTKASSGGLQKTASSTNSKSTSRETGVGIGVKGMRDEGDVLRRMAEAAARKRAAVSAASSSPP